MARGDLTDRQWARSEPLSTEGRKPGGPRVETRRQMVDGIRWRPHRDAVGDASEGYGPRGRVCDPKVR
ncbi:transposase [Streptomyces sp. ICN441]|uniref:Uncharacterized protein n=1 Tax=Streptomyces tirandamycinicus TaxID=2174846 RepID=A0A2S1T037_9ACTN|nr:hypothetical protein DDW44_26820 [Streptomyces tirandamycinicus]TFE42663.1 transposase [Streptomyces sp. ICN441]